MIGRVADKLPLRSQRSEAPHNIDLPHANGPPGAATIFQQGCFQSADISLRPSDSLLEFLRYRRTLAIEI